jgi:hypothetical protein
MSSQALSTGSSSGRVACSPIDLGLGTGVRRRLGRQGFRLHRQILRLVDPFQHQIGIEDGLYLHLEIQAGQLQQANRLLQLRGHCQLLTLT